MSQHQGKLISGFTCRYGVDRLVWYRGYGDVRDAIDFEKRLKRWRREWKIRLIEEDNPHWDDLYAQMMRPLVPSQIPVIPVSRSEDRDP